MILAFENLVSMPIFRNLLLDIPKDLLFLSCLLWADREAADSFSTHFREG